MLRRLLAGAVVTEAAHKPRLRRRKLGQTRLQRSRRTPRCCRTSAGDRMTVVTIGFPVQRLPRYPTPGAVVYSVALPNDVDVDDNDDSDDVSNNSGPPARQPAALRSQPGRFDRIVIGVNVSDLPAARARPHSTSPADHRRR